MRRSIRGIHRLVALLGLMMILFPAGAAAGEDKGPGVGDWQLPAADGSRIGLHEALSGGPVIVSFWALWCKPCLKELPHLEKLADDFSGQLTVLAVNIDSQRSVAKVRPFLRSKRYRHLKVPLDTAGDLSRRMQVGKQVPFLVLYDSDGEVVYQHVGYKEGDEKILRAEIQKLLIEDEAVDGQR